MKKGFYYLSILAVSLITILGVTFASCSDDDKDGGDSSKVIGTWVEESRYETAIFTFKSGGAGTITWIEDDGYSGEETETYKFNYTMKSANSGVITYKEYDSYYDETYTETFYFEFEDDVMYVYYDDDGDLELEFTLYKKK